MASQLSQTSANSLYITLQYLRNVDGQNKYHWALYSTESRPPEGYLLHATDTGRAPLNLYKEIRRVSNPTRSKTMVVCLKVANSPGMQILDQYASSIRLMDPRYLPRGERQWTCRVWVKQLLTALYNDRRISLPYSVDSIEKCCQILADRNIRFIGQPRVLNDVSWIQPTTLGPTTPMEIDETGVRARHYGSSPMDIDSSGFRGKPTSINTYSAYRY